MFLFRWKWGVTLQTMNSLFNPSWMSWMHFGRPMFLMFLGLSIYWRTSHRELALKPWKRGRSWNNQREKPTCRSYWLFLYCMTGKACSTWPYSASCWIFDWFLDGMQSCFVRLLPSGWNSFHQLPLLRWWYVMKGWPHRIDVDDTSLRHLTETIEGVECLLRNSEEEAYRKYEFID